MAMSAFSLPAAGCSRSFSYVKVLCLLLGSRRVAPVLDPLPLKVGLQDLGSALLGQAGLLKSTEYTLLY